MQLEEGIPIDSNGFKPSYSFIMHFLLSQYFTAVLWNIMTSTWVTVLEFKGCLKHLPAWVSFQCPTVSQVCDGARRTWAADHRIFSAPESGADYCSLGSRGVSSWCLVISAKWVDLHQYWVSQDSKVNRCELDIHRIPHISTILGTQRRHIQTCPSAKPLSFAVALIFKGHFSLWAKDDDLLDEVLKEIAAALLHADVNVRYVSELRTVPKGCPRALLAMSCALCRSITIYMHVARFLPRVAWVWGKVYGFTMFYFFFDNLHPKKLRKRCNAYYATWVRGFPQIPDFKLQPRWTNFIQHCWGGGWFIPQQLRLSWSLWAKGATWRRECFLKVMLVESTSESWSRRLSLT